MKTLKTPLADYLIELRQELERARLEGEPQGLRFRVESIELELKVAVTQSGETGAGFKFWVIDAEAKGSLAAESVQTLTLKLAPYSTDAEGNRAPLDVSDRRSLAAPDDD